MNRDDELKPLNMADGREPCQKCGQLSDLSNDETLWSCPVCLHEWPVDSRLPDRDLEEDLRQVRIFHTPIKPLTGNAIHNCRAMQHVTENIVQIVELAIQLKKDVARLRQIISGMAKRISDQSELLSRRAEKKDV